MMKTRLLGAAALGLLVAACGTQPQERVTGGAAAGAATGAGIGALGGPAGVLAGAAIGAGAGAATGAVTEPSTVNLGEPPWSNPEARIPGTGSTSRSSGASSSGGGSASSDTRQLQQALRERGFDPGPIDGVYGPRTSEAVRDWQRSNNMEATGRPSQRMRQELNLSSNTQSGRSTSDRDRAYMGGGMVVGQGANSPVNRDRSGVATDADPGTGGTGGSGGSTRSSVPSNNTGTGNMGRTGSTMGPSGATMGGGQTNPQNFGNGSNPQGGALERRGAATDADPGTGGTGGSGGGSTAIPRR